MLSDTESGRPGSLGRLLPPVLLLLLLLTKVTTNVPKCTGPNCGRGHGDAPLLTDTKEADEDEPGSFHDDAYSALKSSILENFNMKKRPSRDLIAKVKNSMTPEAHDRLRKASDSFLWPSMQNNRPEVINDPSLSANATFIGKRLGPSHCQSDSICLEYNLGHRLESKNPHGLPVDNDVDYFERFDSRSYISVDSLKLKLKSVKLLDPTRVGVSLYVFDGLGRKISEQIMDKDEWTLFTHSLLGKITVPLPLKLKYPIIRHSLPAARTIQIHISGILDAFDCSGVNSILSISYGRKPVQTDESDEKKLGRLGRNVRDDDVSTCLIPDFCCIHTRRFYFHYIHWDDWIISPSYIDLHFCKGGCNQASPNITFYYTLMKAAMLSYWRTWKRRQLCCAPLRLFEFGIAYYDSWGNFTPGSVPDAQASECICS